VGEKEEQEHARIPLGEKKVRLRAEVRFEGPAGIVRFFCQKGNEWIQAGPAHTMHFRLDHFTGCRFGLYCYSTQETGGSADFSCFRISREE